MSFFGKGFGAAFAQTLEAVGSIVAPLPDEDDLNISNISEDFHPNRHPDEDEKLHDINLNRLDEHEDDIPVFSSTSLGNPTSLADRLLPPTFNAADSPVSHLSEVDLSDTLSQRSDTYDAIEQESKAPSMPIMSAISSSFGFNANAMANSNNPFQNYKDNISAALFFSSSNDHESEQVKDDPNEEFDRMASLQQRVKDYAIKYEALMNEKLELASDNKTLKQRLEQQEGLSNSLQQLKTELSFERTNNIQLNNSHAQMKYKLQNQISDLESEVTSLKSIPPPPPLQDVRSEELMEQVRELEQAIASLQVEKQLSDEKVIQLEQHSAQLTNQISQLRQDKDEYDKSHEKSIADASKYKNLYENLQLEFKQQSHELEILQKTSAMHSSQDSEQSALLRQQISEMNRSFADKMNDKDYHIDELTRKIASLSAEVNELQSALASKSKEFESSAAEMSAFASERSSLISQLEESAHRYQEAQSDYQALEERLQGYINHEAHQEQAIQLLHSQVHELRSQLQSSSSSNDTQHQALAAENRQLIQKYHDLEMTLVSTQQELKIAENAVLESAQSIQESSAKLSKAQSSQQQDEVKLATLTSDYNACFNELVSLQQDLKDKDRLLLENQAMIEELNQKVQILESKSSSNNHQQQQQDSSVDKDATIIGLMSQIQLLESQLASHQPHSSPKVMDDDLALVGKCEDLRSLIDEIYLWIGEASPTTSASNTQRNDTSYLLTASSKTINDLRSLVIQANEELEVQMNNVEKLQSQLSDLHASKTSYQEKMQEGQPAAASISLEIHQQQILSKDEMITQQKEKIANMQLEVDSLQEKLIKLEQDNLQQAQLQPQSQSQPIPVEPPHVDSNTSRSSFQSLEIQTLQSELSQAREDLQAVKGRLSK
jgi:chromosome segregation ATPase